VSSSIIAFNWCHLSDGGGGSRGRDSRGGRSAGITVGLGLSAIAGDVASLATAVAGLAGGVEGSAVGSSAIAGNVAELATGVALHGLSLAVPCEVVGTAALVAGGRATRAAGESTAETSKSATGGHGSTGTNGAAGAVACQMAGLSTAVAASAGTSTAQAKGGAISLDVTETLAVVALLGLSGARMRAGVGLMTGLLAVVAQPLRGRAHLSIVANVATLEASTTRQGRHPDQLLYSNLFLNSENPSHV